MFLQSDFNNLRAKFLFQLLTSRFNKVESEFMKYFRQNIETIMIEQIFYGCE